MPVRNSSPPRRLSPVTLLLGALISALSQFAASSDEALTYVYRCEGEADAVVVQVDGDRGHLFARGISEPISQAADGERYLGETSVYHPDRPADLAPGQTASIQLDNRSLENCRNDSRAAVWEAAKLRGVSYRAIGQEPGWVLEIDRDQGFLLVSDYGSSRERIPYAEPLSNPATRTARYESQLDGEVLVIEITGVDCRDSMSGESFESRVTVNWRNDQLQGCGRALH